MTSGKPKKNSAFANDRVAEARSDTGSDSARPIARRRASTPIPAPFKELEDVAPNFGGAHGSLKKRLAERETEATPARAKAAPAAAPASPRMRMSAPEPFKELEDVAPEFGGGDGALKKLRARFGGEADAQPRGEKPGKAEPPSATPTPRRLSAAQAQSGVKPDKPAPLPRNIAALDRTILPPLFGEEAEQDVFPNTGRDATGKLQQMQELQHLLHNPLNIDLRQAMLDHSSSRSEVATRLGDLRHRLAMIQALSGVIGEEIEQLETLLAAMDAPKN